VRVTELLPFVMLCNHVMYDIVDCLHIRTPNKFLLRISFLARVLLASTLITFLG
jgi:hypothetical protein